MKKFVLSTLILLCAVLSAQIFAGCKKTDGGHAHVFGGPEWVWEDESHADAVFICAEDGHAERVNAEVSSEVVLPATCAEDGETLSKASVTFGGKTYEDERPFTVFATDHDYVFSGFVRNGHDAEAKLVCRHDDSHVIFVPAAVNELVTEPASCESEGKAKLVAVFGEHEEEVEIALSSLGHDYEFSGFLWKRDKAQAKYVCTRDNDHVLLFDAEVTSRSTKEPSCTERGVITYVALYADRSESITLPYDMAEHDYSGGVCKFCGEREPTAGLVYTLNGDGAILCSLGDSTDKDVVISSVYMKKPVVGIDYQVFYGRSDITSVSLPKTLETIGDRAFYGCSSLTSLSVPDGVKSIGAAAFYNCSSLSRLEFGDSLESLSVNAFENCSSLVSVGFAASPATLPSNVFKGCSALVSVTLSEGLTEIGSYAFCDCEKLTSITFPESLVKIGACAFSGCSTLQCVSLPDGVTALGKNAFEGCVTLTEVKLSSGLTAISERAFYNCRALRTLVIPDAVETVKASAFENAYKLFRVTLGKNLANIGDKAFSSCANLYEVVNDSALNVVVGSKDNGCVAEYAKAVCRGNETKITTENGVSLFSDGDDVILIDCANALSVVLSASVTEISAYAFYECTALKCVFYEGTQDMWSNVRKNGGVFATVYFYSETDHQTSGNFWRYDGDRVPLIL